MDADESDLWLLASAYFHQDWRLIDATPEDVVLHFIRAEGPESAKHAAAEIAVLLAQPASEEQLAQLWSKDHRAQFTPTRAGLSYQQWFERMLEILRAAADG